MSCPTCDHTMQNLVPQVFWCPRCGTVKMGDNECFPSLVGKCRTFSDQLSPSYSSLWVRLGIHDSLWTTEERERKETMPSLGKTF